MRSRETSFAPSLYRVSTDTLIDTLGLAEPVCCFYKHLLCVTFVMYCVVFTCKVYCFTNMLTCECRLGTKI